jgi:hypothetical protein
MLHGYHAAQVPAEVEKLVVMDAFLPGVAGTLARRKRVSREPITQ